MLGARIGLGASTTICAALGFSTEAGGVVCIAAVVGVGALEGSSTAGAFGGFTLPIIDAIRLVPLCKGRHMQGSAAARHNPHVAPEH